MDENAQLKLQSYLDGELPEREARDVAAWVEKDPEAAARLEDLRLTRKALEGFESDLKLPESREFYWSKIQREIQRQESGTLAAASVAPWFLRFRRLLVPATALALVVLAGLFITSPGQRQSIGSETALPDTGAFTYRDYASGTTLVWLSYPADKEIAADDESGTIE